MRISNNYFEEKGKSFQEIMSQFLVLYYNDKLVNRA